MYFRQVEDIQYKGWRDVKFLTNILQPMMNCN